VRARDAAAAVGDLSDKLAFHDADTDTDTRTSSPTSSRECRRVVQIATGITSVARVGRVGEDPREVVGVGVGVVECALYVYVVISRGIIKTQVDYCSTVLIAPTVSDVSAFYLLTYLGAYTLYTPPRWRSGVL